MAISPSAIEKYELCERRYFWNYVLKDWEPQTQTPAAEAGTAVHLFLETGEVTGLEGYDVHRLGERMKNYIPPSESVACEHRFKTEIEGIEFSGIVDRLQENFIIDFKTSGSDARYAKTDRKLLNDVQRLIYAAAFPEVPRSRWITGLWRDYSVVIGERENVPEDRERFRLHVLQPAEKMLALAQTPGIDPLSLPLPGKQDKYTGLTKACNAFGKPCPRIALCFPKKRLRLSLPATLSPDPEGGMTPKSGRLLGSAPVDAEILSAEAACPLVTDKGETRTPFSLSGSPTNMPNDVPWPGDKKTVKPKYLIENLYIDCMPIVPYPPGESLEYSYEYVAAAGAEVASDMGVASPMLVDFGKGPHLVTAQLIANLSDRSEPIKHLFLETRSAEGRACMQELTSRAKSVVKGCY